jgi:hypothetical protein
MSLYEGLSLVLSTVGTIFTVFLGFRQLRQAAPATAPAVPAAQFGVAAPSAGWGSAAPTYGAYTAPAPAYPGQPQYRPVPTAGAAGTTYGPPPGAPTSPYPQSPPVAWRPPAPYSAPSAPVRVRPKPVRMASILLFAVAALQPLVLLTYYGIEYAMNPTLASADFDDAGVADIAVFGISAGLCGILGIFVARGSRVAAWHVWVAGVLAVPFAILIALALVLSMAMPNEEQTHAGLLAVVVSYLLVVSIALAWSAILLLNSQARAFFFGARR